MDEEFTTGAGINTFLGCSVAGFCRICRWGFLVSSIQDHRPRIPFVRSGLVLDLIFFLILLLDLEDLRIVLGRRAFVLGACWVLIVEKSLSSSNNNDNSSRENLHAERGRLAVGSTQ